MNILRDLSDLREWLAALSPEFALLLALPFAIAFISFAAEAVAHARRPARRFFLACLLVVIGPPYRWRKPPRMRVRA